ncbi:hypothetical protein J3F84DRAFT_369554 [Trichoderma pleuroticola]
MEPLWLLVTWTHRTHGWLLHLGKFVNGVNCASWTWIASSLSMYLFIGSDRTEDFTMMMVLSDNVSILHSSITLFTCR